MGSGKHLKNAINKYGIENFEKEILEYFNSSDEMYSREKEIVNEEFVRLEETYNLRLGGNGGWDYNNKYVLKKLFNDKDWKKKFSIIMSEVNKRSYEKGERKIHENFLYGFKDKNHTLETKQKMHETHKRNGHQQGEKNSCYGTCWIHSLELKQSKKIKKEELDSYLSLGWAQGRKMKF